LQQNAGEKRSAKIHPAWKRSPSAASEPAPAATDRIFKLLPRVKKGANKIFPTKLLRGDRNDVKNNASKSSSRVYDILRRQHARQIVEFQFKVKDSALIEQRVTATDLGTNRFPQNTYYVAEVMASANAGDTKSKLMVRYPKERTHLEYSDFRRFASPIAPHLPARSDRTLAKYDLQRGFSEINRVDFNKRSITISGRSR